MESKPHSLSAARGHVLLATLALLGACAATPEINSIDDQVDRYLAARRSKMAAAAADFRQRASFPRVERHPTGTLILQHGDLLGFTDQEFVRLRVTYLNESTATYDRISLRFTVVDGSGRARCRKTVDFVMPLDYRFVPGNSYTDEVHVPTGGAHESPGFDVRVEMSAETW